MLLTDVALIHAQGKNTIVNESFKDLALDTISKLVSKNHWEEAYVCRDFLLTHFPATFPAWRTNHTTRHASSRTTFAQLHDAVQKRELELSENDIPKDLKRHFLRSTQ